LLTPKRNDLRPFSSKPNCFPRGGALKEMLFFFRHLLFSAPRRSFCFRKCFLEENYPRSAPPFLIFNKTARSLVLLLSFFRSSTPIRSKKICSSSGPIFFFPSLFFLLDLCIFLFFYAARDRLFPRPRVKLLPKVSPSDVADCLGLFLLLICPLRDLKCCAPSSLWLPHISSPRLPPSFPGLAR